MAYNFYGGYGQQSFQPQVPVGQETAIQLPTGRFLCAENSGNYAVDRTQIGDWEKFRVESVGPNLYAFRNFHNKVVCWNNGNNRFENRDAVGDWERFELRPSGLGNQFFLFNPNQQVFITFDHGSPRAVRSQYEAQPITLLPASHKPHPSNMPAPQIASWGLTNGQVSIQFPNGRYFCAEPSGNFAVDRTQIGDWEKFRVESVGPNLYAIRTAHNKVVCWNNGSNHFETRDAVGDWERFELRPAGPNQYFLFNPNQQVFITFDQGFPRAVRNQYEAQPVAVLPSSPEFRQGFYMLRNAFGRFIEENGGRLTQAHQPTYGTRFFFEDLPGSNTFAIRCPSENNRVVCFDATGNFQFRDAVGDWEKIEVRAVPGRPGKFSIYNAAHRKYMRSDDNGWLVNFSDVAGDWEQYEVIPTQ